jgi:hypothetical protein
MIFSRDGEASAMGCVFTTLQVKPLNMVDKLISLLQTHFGPVFGDEVVQRGLLFPE